MQIESIDKSGESIMENQNAKIKFKSLLYICILAPVVFSVLSPLLIP